MEGKNPIGTADLEWIFARNCEGTEQLRKIEFFNREICVCAHLTQTRHVQKMCAEMRGKDGKKYYRG